jgi:hypothetical protein
MNEIKSNEIENSIQSRHDNEQGEGEGEGDDGHENELNNVLEVVMNKICFKPM